MLKNLQQAPEFSLRCQKNDEHSLAKYAGQPIVLAFVRGKACPTTKKYLAVWQDAHARIKDLGVKLLMICIDSVDDNALAAEKFGLKYPFLSDPNLETSLQYGIYKTEQDDGKTFGEPALVIVDAEGKVAYSVISSGPKGLPQPEDIFSILIYMSQHDGKY